jgi:hypothetical protein
MNYQFAFCAALAVVCLLTGHGVFAGVMLFIGLMFIPRWF